MKSINYYDSSYSPNEACEATNAPNCYSCGDGGYIDDTYNAEVYCDCSEGERQCVLDAEIEADMKAEQHAERMFTDHAYAIDSQTRNDDPEMW
jgi:hypothetical protein